MTKHDENKSWEVEAVEEILGEEALSALRARERTIEHEMRYTEHLIFEAGLFGMHYPYLDERWYTLEEDLQTVQDEIENATR